MSKLMVADEVGARDVGRHRGWIWTLNNYTDDEVEAVKAVPHRYLCYGKEVGASGTPHLQGFIYFQSARKWDQVRRVMPDRVSSIQCPNGDADCQRNYCKKSRRAPSRIVDPPELENVGDNWYEDGEMPMSQKGKGECNIDRYNDARVAGEEGRYRDIPADLWARHQNAYKADREEALRSVRRKSVSRGDNWWFYGSGGTGKSLSARCEFPGTYDKMLNKWWDGYKYEDFVIIDDIHPIHAPKFGSFLKRWADRYPFSCEIKNHVVTIRPKVIIVTSNYSIEEVFKDYPEDLQPLLERFQVRHFVFPMTKEMAHVKLRKLYLTHPEEAVALNGGVDIFAEPE